MSILSGLFGSSSDSENDSSGDLLGALTAVASVDGSFESYNESVDDDGSSETSYNSGSIGTDLDIGSILSSMTDSSSESDGLFG